MIETQNISLKNSVNPNSFGYTSQKNITQQPTYEGSAKEASNKRETQLPLELYGGSGDVRVKQPALLGTHIDVII